MKLIADSNSKQAHILIMCTHAFFHSFADDVYNSYSFLHLGDSIIYNGMEHQRMLKFCSQQLFTCIFCCRLCFFAWHILYHLIYSGYTCVYL